MIHISCGSYDRAVTGFEIGVNDLSDVTPAVMVRKYATASHSGPVRCLASRYNILASGGDDEIVRLYDISRMIEIGMLMHQEGNLIRITCRVQLIESASITHLDFGQQIMLSGAENGTIALWLIKDWSHICTMKAHKGKIAGLAVHPSGLLALSLGADRLLIMWDLVAKKKVLTIKAKSNSALLKWSATGSHYMIVCDQETRIFDSDGNLAATFRNPSKVVSVCFLNEAMAATGGEDGVIRVWDIKNCVLLHELEHHKNRVSALDLVKIDGQLLFASSSSDGSIAVWDADRKPFPAVVALADAKLRVTSIRSVETLKFDAKDRRHEA